MLERFRLDGEVAVITGGGNGIGRATAAALVEAGAAVALFDRDEKAVKETEAALGAAGAEVEAYVLDITDEIAVETSFEGVNRRWGRLDILVNNAGISIRHPTLELSLADWNNVVAVNMTGAFRLVESEIHLGEILEVLLPSDDMIPFVPWGIFRSFETNPSRFKSLRCVSSSPRRSSSL